MSYIIGKACISCIDGGCLNVCPVDCIHWVDYTELKNLEADRKYQVIPVAGYPVEHGVAITEKRRKKQKLKKSSS